MSAEALPVRDNHLARCGRRVDSFSKPTKIGPLAKLRQFER